MKKIALALAVTLGLIMAVSSLTTAADPEPQNVAPTTYEEYTTWDRFRMAAAFWADPDKAQNAAIVLHVSMKSPESVAAGYGFLKAGGRFSIYDPHQKTYKVVGADEAVANGYIDLASEKKFFEWARERYKDENIGVVLGAKDWTMRSPLAIKFEAVGKPKKLVSWPSGEIGDD